jgi:hypothetical protein
MKTPSTVGSVKPTPQKMNDVSTPKSKRKIDLSAIVEEENDTELPDILNVREKIDDINSNKSLPVKKRKIENVTVENNEIEKHNQRLSRACIVHLVIKRTNWSYVKTISCSGSHLGITINIKNTKFVKDLPMIDAQFRFNQCNSFREEDISVFSRYGPVLIL